MATEIWVNISSGNGLLPDGTKSLPEPMLTDHQWSPVTFIAWQFHKRCLKPSITKIYLKNTCLKFHWNFPGANELTHTLPTHRSYRLCRTAMIVIRLLERRREAKASGFNKSSRMGYVWHPYIYNIPLRIKKSGCWLIISWVYLICNGNTYRYHNNSHNYRKFQVRNGDFDF